MSDGRSDVPGVLWQEVDGYISDRLVPEDDALAGALQASDAAGLPAIHVSAPHGRFLYVLALAIGARSVLEIGTLGGYSTIWLARGVGPDGRVVTLEAVDRHADVARQNLERAGVADRVDVLVGAARDTLETLRGHGPFDLVFVDADKGNNPHYLQAAIDLGKPGTVVVVDNVVRNGAVADSDSTRADVVGTREMFDLAGRLDGFDATAIQTVGSKGYDGFLIGVVR